MKRLSGVPSCEDKLVGNMEQRKQTPRAAAYEDAVPLSGNCREARS